MKILLLGEYSNVHATLADGLRELGHEVCVVSDGDGWKNYPRDVDVKRPLINSVFGGLRYWLRLRSVVHRLEGFDVVQLINPVFLPLKAERHFAFYDYLRRHNGKVFLGAFGMDYYYAKAALGCRTFRYSDFNIGDVVRHSEQNDIWVRDWVRGAKGLLNRRIAEDCDGIVAGLYEYYAAYAETSLKSKLAFIPFPIKLTTDVRPLEGVPQRVRFFIGIQRARSAYKGTDIMLRALKRVAQERAEECDVVRVESVPFEQYQRLLAGSHVMLDQLYSYTPSMNSLEAMAHGMVVVGGGEPENYEILEEKELHPIINVEPTEESVYEALNHVLNHKADLPRLSADSYAYIRKLHDYKAVAQRYLDFWKA